MFRKARTKVAASISVIQEGEDFLYNSSIRPPLHKSVPIGNISYSNILDTSHLNFGFEKPFLSKPFFKLGNSSLKAEDLSYLFTRKVKTNAVFFQLLYVPSKIILHKDIEPKPSDSKANLKLKKLLDANIEVKLKEPDIKDYLQNLKTKVEKVELLKEKNFSFGSKATSTKEINVKKYSNETSEINVRSFGKLTVKKVKSDAVGKIPKINKIEVPAIGKLLTSVSNVNLVKLIMAAIKKSPLINFEPPSVSSEELSFLTSETINLDLANVQNLVTEPEEMSDLQDLVPELGEMSDIEETVEESEEVIDVQETVDESKEISDIQFIDHDPRKVIDELNESLNVSEPEETDVEEDETLNLIEQEEIVIEEEESINVSEPEEIVVEVDESLNVIEPEEIVIEEDELENVREQEEIVREPSPKVEREELEDQEIVLNEFEDKNTRFLAENKRAFLAEELGLQKIKEAVAALKLLYQNGVINSTLIVLPEALLGHSEEAKQLGVSIGWIGNLEEYCRNLSYSVVKGDDKERLNAWKKLTPLHLVDHKTFLNDYKSNILQKQRLTIFDCVIIDEVQELLNNSDESAGVLKEMNPDIFWVLSSIVGDNILSSLNKCLNDNCRIEERKVRFLTDGAEEEAVINHEEFWLEPNKLQRIEYKENFVSCRKDLKKVLESGNPFRYQSNIFTLVHKLYQIQNFSHGNYTSPKSELLIQHIKVIEKNLKKVIVISQYDREGTKKIEQLFDQHKISYITVPMSLSGEEMEKAVSLFKSRKSITVFLTNAKISRLNFRDFIVPYVIRFDSWWNPALLWQTKNLFDISKSNRDKNVVNVFTYKMLNTIDELIKRILIAKNYMDDNIVSAMSPTAINDLIVVDDWLKIFDMPIEDNKEILQKLYEETIENLHNLSFKDYKDTLIRFFFTIGYANTKITEDQDSESFDISGKGKSGNQIVHLACKVLAEEIITRENLKQIISDVSPAQKNNTFIITRGKFEKGCSEIAKNKVTLLDVERLAAYLVNLQLVQPSAGHQDEE